MLKISQNNDNRGRHLEFYFHTGIGNWFQCFPVYPGLNFSSSSGSSSVFVSGSSSGFRIPDSDFSIRPVVSVVGAVAVVSVVRVVCLVNVVGAVAVVSVVAVVGVVSVVAVVGVVVVVAVVSVVCVVSVVSVIGVVDEVGVVSVVSISGGSSLFQAPRWWWKVVQ